VISIIFVRVCNNTHPRISITIIFQTEPGRKSKKNSHTPNPIACLSHECSYLKLCCNGLETSEIRREL